MTRRGCNSERVDNREIEKDDRVRNEAQQHACVREVRKGTSKLPFLRDDDRVADVSIEKLEALDDPRIESTVNVRLHFFHDVLTVLQPRQIGARCSGENRVFTFFAVVSVMHRSVGTASSSDSPARRKESGPSLRATGHSRSG